jgi:hypothetical protein
MYWAEDRLGKKRLKPMRKIATKAGTIALGTDFQLK